jgi:hypothetical protein
LLGMTIKLHHYRFFDFVVVRHNPYYNPWRNRRF